MSRINAAFLRALDLNADPVSGGQAFVYNAGTTDPVRTYSDVQLTNVQASPVVADAAGNFPDIYAASGSYKVVIQDAESVTLYEADNVDIGGSSLVGSISPEDYTARGDGTGDDTDAMREFFAALPGRVGDLTPGATYVINSKLIIPGGDFTLNANGATLDFSGISNDDGDVAGALLAVSGTEQSTNQIITITTATTAFGLITTTVTMNDEHGLSVGDEVLVSSDDIIDTGHNDANERRGQFMRVEELQGAFSFKSTQKLYEALPTNPVLTPISWAENIHIDGILRIKGPGRRPTEAGFIGLSFKYVRDVNIGDLVTEDVDYQVLSRDNCLRAHAGNLTFRFPPQGASTAVQYGDTFKNASTDCSTLSITSYGGKHPFDWTRNTTPGIGRHTHIGHILAYDTWDSVVATHGNSRDLNFTSVKGLNCLYVFGSRVADVRVDDIYGENCYEVLKITDDTRNLSVGSVRGKNVSFVVRAKDTPTTSNEGWIGSLESRNINIERVEGLGVTNNTLFLDWSDIPVFTEADAAVTGGSATTILLGSFPAPAGFSDNQYNFSGALTGSEIAMDWDGAGGGTVQTRTITGHTYAGGVNTLTVSGWTNNPVAGTSTYTIRSFVDDINIGRVISKNCVGSDVFVTGNLRRLVIGDMDVISETNLATAAVLIQGTANTYPDGVAFGAIRRFQKTAPVVSSFAQNVTFEEISAAEVIYFDSRALAEASTYSAIVDRIAVTAPDGATMYYVRGVDGVALTGADGSTWVPDGVLSQYHYGDAGGDVTVTIPSDFDNLQDAFDFFGKLSVPKFILVNVTIEAGHQPASGLMVQYGDWGNFWINSIDATVTLAAGATAGFGTAFIWTTNATCPVINVLFDIDGIIDIGMTCVNSCTMTVRPNKGFINSTVHNLEIRRTDANIESAIFDGAGVDGVRIEQACSVKAQLARADDCGNAGFEVSRRSKLNVMSAQARRCGLITLAASPSDINNGGLVSRRSEVAADSFDADGSTHGISCQLTSTVNAPSAVLTNCTAIGLRASSLSSVNLGGGNVSGSVSGVSLGFMSSVLATTVDFTGTTTSYVLFATGSVLDITGATLGGAAGGNVVTLNVPSPLGTVWRNDDAAAMLSPKQFSFTVADDAATSFLVPGSGTSRAIVAAISFPASQASGLFDARVTNEQCRIIAGGTTLEATTGILTGTTGTDTKLTVSAHSDGRIYIENRTGTSQSIGVTILSQNKI